MYHVEETKDGYIIYSSEYESYPIPDPTRYGFTNPIHLDKKVGTFSIRFENKDQFNNFFKNSV